MFSEESLVLLWYVTFPFDVDVLTLVAATQHFVVMAPFIFTGCCNGLKKVQFVNILGASSF